MTCCEHLYFLLPVHSHLDILGQILNRNMLISSEKIESVEIKVLNKNEYLEKMYTILIIPSNMQK